MGLWVAIGDRLASRYQPGFLINQAPRKNGNADAEQKCGGVKRDRKLKKRELMPSEDSCEKVVTTLGWQGKADKRPKAGNPGTSKQTALDCQQVSRFW